MHGDKQLQKCTFTECRIGRMILYNSIKIVFVYIGTTWRGGKHDCIKLRKVITVVS